MEIIDRPPRVRAAEIMSVEHEAIADRAAGEPRDGSMFRVNKNCRPRLRLGVEITHVRVNLTLLARPRGIHDPDILDYAPVQNPADDELPRAVRTFPVFGKVGVFDLPGADQAIPELGLIAE